MINDPSVPIRFYNCSYIQGQLLKHYGEKVSLPVIVERAKNQYYIVKPETGLVTMIGSGSTAALAHRSRA